MFDLGRFDGSGTVRRTRGEPSAECHGDPDYIRDFRFELFTGEQRDPDEQTLVDEIEGAAGDRWAEPPEIPVTPSVRPPAPRLRPKPTVKRSNGSTSRP